MKFPNFIIVGCMKCGTTPLWHNLNKHPDICMGKNYEDPKIASTEIRFWNNGQPHHTWLKGLDWYKNIFENGKCCGEKSANYIEQQSTMKRMYEHIPDVKLVLCIREPVSRAYSEFNMQKDKLKSTEFSIDLVFQRGYVERSMYYCQIKNHVLPFFPPENLYIVIQERMQADTNSELNKLYEFLNIDSYNLSIEETTAEIAKNKQLDLKKDGKVKIYKTWQSKYGPMLSEVRDSLARYFSNHNEKLFDFLGYEIQEWKNGNI